jgi:pterin-4a-carbinolamine dehydratase
VIKNVYNRVELQLNTHDADNQVTELDIVLANSINQIGLGSE